MTDTAKVDKGMSCMRRMLMLVVMVAGLAALPGTAAAATCADYSNQADAQRAADTRDADGDGIYCESLPCPCLKPGDSSGGGGDPGGGGGATKPKPTPKPTPTAECGVERWPVKTLTDTRAARVNFAPVDSTVIDLRSLQPPDISGSAQRQAGEFTTYRLSVRLRSFKIESDSDIHLVVADTSDATKTMIVELPNAGCARTAGSKSRQLMASARRALLRSCGSPSSGSFHPLTGTATITGVAFFDVLHGQRGVAPNGIELHPLLSFRARTHCGSR